MTRYLWWQSLRYYWRTHLGVVIGVTVATAVIVGALVVGDSVAYSLRRTALQRLGQVHLAISPGDRFFRDDLAGELAGPLETQCAAVLQAHGLAVRPDGSARSNAIRVLGISHDFWQLAQTLRPIDELEAGGAVLNEPLARQLGASVGDDIMLRVPKPGTLPRDMPLAPDEDASVALRVRVTAIVGPAMLGGFSLSATQLPPHNAFVSRDWLQHRLDLDGRANLLLTGGGTSVDKAENHLAEIWQLADAEMVLLHLDGRDVFELRSRRVFIDEQVNVLERAKPILSYFVNEIRAGGRATPYSIVAAIEADHDPIVKHLGDDQIVINRWLADDLDAEIGTPLTLKYFLVGDDNQLIERSNQLTVQRIVPLTGLAADHRLMPDFPGLADAEHCRQWEPGIPIQLDRIRDEDEAYWDLYRGTPKAFVTLVAGQAMWGNRFGNLTAIRIHGKNRDTIEQRIRQRLDPSVFGLRFQDLRGDALRASRDALPFGQLFLSLSSMLVFVAVMLTALLFVFGIEQRSSQLGTLRAVGWPSKRIQRLLLCEGLVLATLGSAIGSGGGLLYARLVLGALSTVWRDAVASAQIWFHVTPTSLVGGALSGTFIAIGAMAWTLRRLLRRTARQLLVADETTHVSPGQSQRWSIVVAGTGLLAAMALLRWDNATAAQVAVARFFGVGSLLLLVGLCLCRAMLAWAPRLSGTSTLLAMAARDATRRRGRSLAIIVLLASGVFLVVAVGANRLGSAHSAEVRRGGTGGFALFGQSSLPIRGNLNKPDGKDAFGLEAADLPGVSFVSLRVRDGDDASCLNLNRAQQPRLVGVRPEALHSRFRFARILGDHSRPWQLLADPRAATDPVPAVADEATVVWALGKKLGDTLTYTDEHGASFQIQFVATVANSILQGMVLIDHRTFEQRYPSVTGYRMLLIDTPVGRAEDVRAMLSRATEDVGLELTPTARRLAAFNAVQNTYLTIFQALGGLAMVLASCGLGAVVLRNVLERRGQLALLRAVGFTRSQVRSMLFYEHGMLLGAGLLCGTMAASAAVFPTLHMADSTNWLVPTLTAVIIVLVTGLIWILLATVAALKGPLVRSLRTE